MRMGFTGTRKGMTKVQLLIFTALLKKKRPKEFHHGDCKGADEQAHLVAALLDSRVVIHPPVNERMRAHCPDAHEVKEPRLYLERNHAIVDACDVLVATPGESREVTRSGTWATVRYARKLGRKIYIIYPDGTLEVEP